MRGFQRPGSSGSNGGPSQPAGSRRTPQGQPQAEDGALPQGLADRIKDEKDLEPYERLFANVDYWKKLGEEFQHPLFVTGTVCSPPSSAGLRAPQREVYDSWAAACRSSSASTWSARAFILRPKFIFIDGRTGATLYSEAFREERLYTAQQNTPALSSYFELMDRLIPYFLNTLSSQKIRGTRVLLK